MTHNITHFIIPIVKNYGVLTKIMIWYMIFYDHDDDHDDGNHNDDDHDDDDDA